MEKSIEKFTLRASASGLLKINNVEMDVYVLDDGTPLINKSKMLSLLDMAQSGKSRTDNPVFIGAKNIQSFISEDLQNKMQLIEFMDGNSKKTAYHAEIVPLVAETYLKARDAGILTDKQLPIARRCEIIIRALARVGITALIYEATGFEKFKKSDALRMLVESYLAEEVRKWTKEFPDDFFIALDNVYGNEKTVSRKRPIYYARFINEYIYDPIEKGVILDKLKELNPINEKGHRSKRFHQFLNEEKGIRTLQAQIWQITALLRVSANKRKFKENYERLVNKQQWLDFGD